VIKKQVLEKDLSPKALKTEVYKASAHTPLSVYGATSFVLSSLYLALFGLSSIAVIGAAAGGTIALGNWVWGAIVNGDQKAAKVIQKYRTQMELERTNAIKHLNEELNSLGDIDGKKQIALLGEKFGNFKRILDKKFKPEELTYNRYLSIAEQVYLGALSNLEKASLALQSVDAIDLNHTKSQIRKSKTKIDDETGAALTQRLELWNTQQNKAQELKRKNEIAMTQLDTVSARLASIDTSSKNNTLELDVAIEELQRLIAQAEKYSNTH